MMTQTAVTITNTRTTLIVIEIITDTKTTVFLFEFVDKLNSDMVVS